MPLAPPPTVPDRVPRGPRQAAESASSASPRVRAAAGCPPWSAAGPGRIAAEAASRAAAGRNPRPRGLAARVRVASSARGCSSDDQPSAAPPCAASRQPAPAARCRPRSRPARRGPTRHVRARSPAGRPRPRRTGWPPRRPRAIGPSAMPISAPRRCEDAARSGVGTSAGTRRTASGALAARTPHRERHCRYPVREGSRLPCRVGAGVHQQHASRVSSSARSTSPPRSAASAARRRMSRRRAVSPSCGSSASARSQWR